MIGSEETISLEAEGGGVGGMGGTCTCGCGEDRDGVYDVRTLLGLFRQRTTHYGTGGGGTGSGLSREEYVPALLVNGRNSNNKGMETHTRRNGEGTGRGLYLSSHDRIKRGC